MNQKQRKAKLKRAQHHQQASKSIQANVHQFNESEMSRAREMHSEQIKSSMQMMCNDQKVRNELNSSLITAVLDDSTQQTHNLEYKPKWLVFWLSIMFWFKTKFAKV